MRARAQQTCFLQGRAWVAFLAHWVIHLAESA